MTETVYKLFKLRSDGTLGPLFINARLRIPINQWMPAEDHPTKGFAHRPGWHCTLKPLAPHLALHPKGRTVRVWALCEARGLKRFERPQSQGGTWVLAQELKVVRTLEAHEVEEINLNPSLKEN